MTMRTLKKFGRDLLVTSVGAGLIWAADNVGLLGLSPEVAVIASSVIMLGYRALRETLGYEPAE